MSFTAEETSSMLSSRSTGANLQSIRELLPGLALNVSSAVNTPFRFALFAETNRGRAKTAQDVHGIKAAISNMSSMVEDLDSISGHLETFRRTLNEAILSHSRLISVVNQIPVELLAEIFKLSAQKDVKRRRPKALLQFHRSRRIESNAYGSLNVAQVCRKWREVALSIPTLWNMVKITPGGRIRPSSLPLPLEPVKRSGELPVFIFLELHRSAEFGFAYTDDSPGIYEGVKGIDFEFEEIDAAEIRFEEEIGGRPQWLSLGAVTQVLRQFSNLTHLSLADVEFLDSEEALVHSVFSKTFNRLTHLHVCPLNFSQTTKLIASGTWTNLTVLHLDVHKCFGGLDPQDGVLSTLFANAPNLTELYMLVKGMGFGPWIPVSSSTLRVFAITMDPVDAAFSMGQDARHMESLFDSLTFPSLLHLVAHTRNRESAAGYIRRFLTRSSCHLSSLTLTWYDGKKRQNRQIASDLQQEFAIQSVDYANHMEDTKAFREAKDRWYGLRSSI